MTNDLRYDLQQLGYLARTSHLLTLGHTQRSLAAAVTEGWLRRPLRGWVATPLAKRDAVIAVGRGGVLTDASALDSYDIWSGVDTRVHVLLPPHASRRHHLTIVGLADFAANRRPSTGSIQHWGAPRAVLDGWRVSVLDALTSFAQSQSAEHFVAAVDSAIHTGKLPAVLLAELRLALPERLRPLLLLADGHAEAGTETLARLRLAVLGRVVTIQVTVGPHRLDILIDGWLNIEIDSEAWHGRDRLKNSQRDTWLVGRGYVVLRFDYVEVMFEWAACLRAIVATLELGRPIRPVG